MQLEPAAPRSRVKHSTTEPLRSPTILTNLVLLTKTFDIQNSMEIEKNSQGKKLSRKKNHRKKKSDKKNGVVLCCLSPFIISTFKSYF